MNIHISSQKIVPFLWFDGKAEEALNFYCTVFKNSEIIHMKKWGQNSNFPENWIMSSTAIINGLKIYAFDAGPQFKFNESISFFANCNDQTEIDYLWEALISNGGEEQMCGWCKDAFGISWQIIPDFLSQKMTHGDPLKFQKMFERLMGMRKIILDELIEAYESA